MTLLDDMAESLREFAGGTEIGLRTGTRREYAARVGKVIAAKLRALARLNEVKAGVYNNRGEHILRNRHEAAEKALWAFAEELDPDGKVTP